MYKPPFEISSRTINLIAEISAQIERYAIRLENEGLRLRKANRIRTIHSSLAIEGNNLSEGQVRDIINGKNVVAPLREIQEVKNAIKTYEMYSTLNPFSVDDLLRAHATMMAALTDDAGRFRRGGVGVFSETGLVHMAPPAEFVPSQIGDLMCWLASSDDHLLIRSCVFHYEFEFIHPFSDGNGRMGRLWQSLILGKLHPLFEHLPVENMVFSNQEAYYNAIAESNKLAQSEPFIEFMLGEILSTLKSHQGDEIGGNGGISVGINGVINDGTNVGLTDIERQIINIIAKNGRITVRDVAAELSISLRQAERHFATLKANCIIERKGSNKNGQWIINK